MGSSISPLGVAVFVVAVFLGRFFAVEVSGVPFSELCAVGDGWWVATCGFCGDESRVEIPQGWFAQFLQLCAEFRHAAGLDGDVLAHAASPLCCVVTATFRA